MEIYDFRARSFNWRLYGGHNSIEKYLLSEIERNNANNVFIITSSSIYLSTKLIQRIQETLGGKYAGAYTAIQKDSTYSSVQKATQAARQANADLLIAIGGGSVIVAARAVNIFLCEDKDPIQLMTQYPSDKPAYSPRLLKPKLPIINIPTTPTSAMNRAGTGLKNDELEQRMEYFDPKTRPIALFFDEEAVLSAPLELLRSTATTTFAGALASLAITSPNPLVEGDRLQAFSLANQAYLKIANGHENSTIRYDLCTAAFLSNRAADDGPPSGQYGPRDPSAENINPFIGNYSISTVLHLFPGVGQGEATSVLTATVARKSANKSSHGSEKIARLLGVWEDEMTYQNATLKCADEIESRYIKAGMPTRIRDLPNIRREDFQQIAQQTLHNFNYNRGTRSNEEQLRSSLELLNLAW